MKKIIIAIVFAFVFAFVFVAGNVEAEERDCTPYEYMFSVVFPCGNNVNGVFTQPLGGRSAIARAIARKAIIINRPTVRPTVQVPSPEVFQLRQTVIIRLFSVETRNQSGMGGN